MGWIPAAQHQDTMKAQNGVKSMALPPSGDRVQDRKQKLKRFLLILIGIGVVIGILTSIGVVTVLDQFNLTDDSPQIEAE